MDSKKAKRKLVNSRYCAKNLSKIHQQDKKRKLLWRLNQKHKDKESYEEHKRKDRERKQLKKQANNDQTLPSTSQSATSTATPASAFRHKSTKERSLARAQKALPDTPRRRNEVMAGLAKKLRINLGVPEKKKPGPVKLDLSDDKKQ